MKTLKNTTTAALALACATLFTTSTEAGKDNGNQGQLQTPPPCKFDLNGDGFVDIDDVFLVLGDWGSCSTNNGPDDPGNARPVPPDQDGTLTDDEEPEPCRADLVDDDGFVGANDLLALIENFGECPGRDNASNDG